MNYLYTIILLFIFNAFSNAQSLITPFEQDSNSTCTFDQCISFFKSLDADYKECSIVEDGYTDTDEPFRLVVLGRKDAMNPLSAKKRNKLIVWINNGIHPGEPEGIDASMILARELMKNADLNKLLDKITVVMVPVYNVGGSKNRNSFSRTNQNGPKEYGFRGNSQNLDLNRDFIKCDSRNAISFNKLYTSWSPDIYLETHTSDGADYPYTMTLVNTVGEKLGKPLAQIMQHLLLPDFSKEMKKANDEIVPYVNVEDIPDNGIYAFYESPRFSTGYASLHHTISFLTETHMLKPFPKRVNSTIRFEKIFLSTIAKYSSEILQAKKNNIDFYLHEKNYNLTWTYDLNVADSIDFICYETEKPLSKISGKPRLKYNREKTQFKKIPYYNTFHADKTVNIPNYYILPQAYVDIYNRLKWNGVKMERLERDSFINGIFYKIDSFDTSHSPYENHYLHSHVKLTTLNLVRRFNKGDWIIPTHQNAIKYIIETMEPEGADSFFNWNFFDGILMRKEYFSDYVFEDIAELILKENPDLREKFEMKKKKDKNFSDNAADQLEFIYINSKFAENFYSIYPVARIF